MSEIKVNSIKGVGASTAAITVNNTDGTCTANITNNLSNRNLIINGAQQVAQRLSSSASTEEGFKTIDRFAMYYNGVNENPAQQQADVASGTTPYSLGFRKSFKITNGDQTSGAQNASRVFVAYNVEAQDMANSGWNYTSSSSNITLSFWVKASVAGNYYGYLYSFDGSSQGYSFDTGSLTADTWTKVTKTISGNSNLQFDNDTGSGFYIAIGAYWGTDYTDSGNTMNQWAAWSGSSRTPVNTTGWYTTNDATFEITGMQLEVGSVATDFEHRSYANELKKCERYFEIVATGQVFKIESTGGYVEIPLIFRTVKRADPTMTLLSSEENFVSSVSVVGGNSTEKIYHAGLRGNTIDTTGNKYLYGKASASAEL